MKILDKKGQGLTEYMVLLVIVSLSAVLVTRGLGSQINKTIRKAKNRVRTGIVFNDKDTDRDSSSDGDTSDDG